MSSVVHRGLFINGNQVVVVTKMFFCWYVESFVLIFLGFAASISLPNTRDLIFFISRVPFLFTSQQYNVYTGHSAPSILSATHIHVHTPLVLCATNFYLYSDDFFSSIERNSLCISKFSLLCTSHFLLVYRYVIIVNIWNSDSSYYTLILCASPLLEGA